MKIQGHIIIRRKPKNGDNGQDAVLYELMPSGQIINFSNDNVFSPSFVTCSIKKIQGSNLIMLTTASALSTEGLRLSYAMDDGSDGDTVINPTTKVYPNDKISYINFILKKNEVIIDKKTIQICNDGKDGEKGEDGLQGCILRQSEWVSGVEYRNDEALISGTRYLDIAIVTTGANTFNAYKCLKTHVSSTSIPVTNTTYWQKFNTLQPVYTPLIMAQNAILRFMQGNQLLIMKSDNKTVAAGLVGGNYPLWVGATTPSDAPFKVSINGEMDATKGTIGGWIISADSISSEEVSQSSSGITGKNRTTLKKDGTILGNLFKVSLDGGLIRAKLWDDPVMEWEERKINLHAFVSTPFELTSAIIQGGGNWTSDVLYGKNPTNNLIIEPTNGTVYYALPTNLEKYNGVTLRIYNPATRSSSWGAANAYLVYCLSQSSNFYNISTVSLTNFIGKFTGTALSIPVGKMVVITGVREQVAGGSFGNDRLKWYVEVTA